MSDNLHPLDRIAISAWAIVYLHEIGEISIGMARKLMNSPDIASYREAREKVEEQMKQLLFEDIAELAAANVARAQGE